MYAYIIETAFEELSLRHLRTLLHTAEGLGIAPIALCIVLKRGDIRRFTSTLKPLLLERLKFALHLINKANMELADMRFYVFLDKN